MRKLIIFILGVLFITSCITQKQVVRPFVKFTFFDSETKKELSNVNVYITSEFDSLNQGLEQISKSNIKGDAILKKEEVWLGNHPPVMPLNKIKCVFNKKDYKQFDVILFNLLKINKLEDLKKRYNTHIYLTKIETLPNNVYKK